MDRKDAGPGEAASGGPGERWPALPWDAWQATCDTLHMWTQIVGKVKLACAPFLNELWQVAFHTTARGLTTGPIPYRDGVFEVEFDFIDHELSVCTSDGRRRVLALEPRSVADFYGDFMGALGALGIGCRINPMPVEVPDSIPFPADHAHAAYDPEYVHRWWLILTRTDQLLEEYRSSFVGKSSPVLFYWGSFDLTETRFSGRPAEPPAGAPLFVQLAEDQENMARGFRPAPVRPAAAHYDEGLGEFILLYEDARRSDSPEGAIRDFFESTYEAAATLAHWDRGRLERRS